MAQPDNNDARRVITRAWQDGNFKSLLLRDPRAALKELEIDVPDHLSLSVHDNTGSTHHMVICTPCSCYPSFLGTAPHYWKDPGYKDAIIQNPTSWLEQMGTVLGPDEVLQVVDTDVNSRAFVIPKQPDGEITEDVLAQLVTDTSLVGHTR